MANPNDPMWNDSAKAWIRFVDAGDANRTDMLDEVMMRLVEMEPAGPIVDVGCGEGRFCRMLKDEGHEVIGIEPTTALREMAIERDPEGEYLAGFAEKLPLEDFSAQTLVYYVTWVDIDDLVSTIKEAYRVLRPGGRIVVSNVHPIFTASIGPGWIKDASGKKLHVGIADYRTQRGVLSEWCGIKVINHHRTFDSIFSTLLLNGFRLEYFEEPKPTRDSRLAEDESKVPNFMAMIWRKPWA